MKKLAMATAASALMAGTAFAGSHAMEAKVGVILGYTGPIESLTPMMADSAELALSEINDSGKFLDGVTLAPVRADSTCIDAAAATAGRATAPNRSAGPGRDRPAPSRRRGFIGARNSRRDRYRRNPA